MRAVGVRHVRLTLSIRFFFNLELSSENLRTSFSIVESYILLGGLEFLQVKHISNICCL